VILSRARSAAVLPQSRRASSADGGAGRKEWEACQERGNYYLHLAGKIDRPDSAAPPIERPLPRPPVALRPKRLSVTYIETLRRDPYALYAEKILGLKELDPLGGPSVWGSSAARSMRRWSALSMSTPLDLCRWMRAKNFTAFCAKGLAAIGGRRFRRAHLAAAGTDN